MAKEILEMSVESVVTELPDTKTVRLKWPEGHNPEFKTGQFITVFWPDTPTYKRAYSLSSCALDRGFYEVTIKREGKMGTRVVDWVKPGDKWCVLPPAGKFLPVFEPNKHLICIAGGSGVTPFRGFVREATRRELLQTAHEEALRLNRLVGNLLYMTRLEAGAIPLQRVLLSTPVILPACRQESQFHRRSFLPFPYAR